MLILGPFDWMTNYLIEKNAIIQSTNTVDTSQFTIDIDTNLAYTQSSIDFKKMLEENDKATEMI